MRGRQAHIDGFFAHARQRGRSLRKLKPNGIGFGIFPFDFGAGGRGHRNLDFMLLDLIREHAMDCTLNHRLRPPQATRQRQYQRQNTQVGRHPFQRRRTPLSSLRDPYRRLPGHLSEQRHPQFAQWARSDLQSRTATCKQSGGKGGYWLDHVVVS